MAVEAINRKKRTSQRGNIALLTALTIVPAVGLLGGAVDIVRYTEASAELRNALDGAALAAASLTNKHDLPTTVSEYLKANVRNKDLRDNVVINVPDSTVSLNKKQVTITASYEVDFYFLALIGVSGMTVSAQTTAVQSSTNVELAMVLDISSSMRGSKLTSLKSAAEDFVDQILNDKNIDLTSVSLVPFGGTVNIQELFDEFAVPEASATVDPNSATYSKGTNVPNLLFRFTGADRCIEYRHDDFDSGMLPTYQRAQVPHFWKWNNFNPWCPQDQSAVLLNTNDKEALKTRISGMLLSDGTGMDVGAMWGAKALAPEWSGRLGGDFPSRPAAYDDETLKILVIMTDGEITPQYRPKDFSKLNTHKKNIVNKDPLTSHKGNGGGKNKNQQTILSKGSSNSSSSSSTAVGHFRKVCDDLEGNGVVVYSIGFKIKPNGTADKLLSECASSDSNYFFVEDLNIQAAFNTIAASVNALRISG